MFGLRARRDGEGPPRVLAALSAASCLSAGPSPSRRAGVLLHGAVGGAPAAGNEAGVELVAEALAGVGARRQ